MSSRNLFVNTCQIEEADLVESTTSPDRRCDGKQIM
jgi:hypothetical protein